MSNKIFNLILAGVGGQGLITLGRIILEAAFLEGKNVKMSELHGLSQRGGAVAVHIRIGKKVYSPLVARSEADLVLSLEKNEALRNCEFSSKEKTIFLINDFFIPSLSFVGKKVLKMEEIKGFSKKIYFVNSSKIIKEKLGTEIVTGVYMASLAVFNQLIPIKPVNLLKAIELIAPRDTDLSKRAFELAKEDFSI